MVANADNETDGFCVKYDELYGRERGSQVV